MRWDAELTSSRQACAVPRMRMSDIHSVNKHSLCSDFVGALWGPGQGPIVPEELRAAFSSQSLRGWEDFPVDHLKPEATFSPKNLIQMCTLQRIPQAEKEARKDTNNCNTNAKGYDGQVHNMLWEYKRAPRWVGC